MTKKIVLIVLMVTMATGMAFAQKKQKLGEDAARRLLEKVSNTDVPYSDVDYAIRIISRLASKDAKNGTASLGITWPKGMAPNVKSKKVKQIFELMDAGTDIIGKINTIAEAWDLASRYRYQDKNTTVKKAASLQFDTLDFAAGFFVGGSYYKAGIAAGRAILNMLNEHLGEIRWNDIQANGIGTPTGLVNKYPEHPYSYWKDQDYYYFAKAWFCAAYDSGMDHFDEVGILINAGEYIWAMKTLKRAGLM